MSADAVEIRVLGCLVEKQRTTPDAYPLSLNSLRLACNQSTNRSPVVDYDEREIREALQRLAQRRWTRLASDAGSRAAKYRHLLAEPPLSLRPPELSVLAVLMLRGPQTVGEIRTRADRIHAFGGLDEVQEVLHALAERRLVVRLDRSPGQKEERWMQTMGDTAQPPAGAVSAVAPPLDEAAPAPGDDDRVAALEERVRRLEEIVADLTGRPGEPGAG